MVYWFGVSLFLFLCFIIAYLSVAATATLHTATTIGFICPKCGTNKSGKLSCCARGGAWFQKCGDPGDSKFGHTWNEGIKACRGNCDEWINFRVCSRLNSDLEWCLFAFECLPMNRSNSKTVPNARHNDDMPQVRHYQDIWYSELLRSRW